ncbi:MAG: hypothetical protein ACE5I1_22865, partial [bacterium]
MKKVISVFGFNFVPQHAHSEKKLQQPGQSRQAAKTPFPMDMAGKVKNENTHFEYDANGRLTKAVYPDNTTQNFAYDAFGNLVFRKMA